MFGLWLMAGCVVQNRELTTGTITYVDLEGGFYGIVDEAGNRYLPLDLPPEFEKDGLRVVFRAVPARDRMSIQMWGVPVQLESIERQNN